jgi:hypothetical protein
VPGEGPVVPLLDLSGHWTHRDRHQHHHFPIDVPERTVELRLRWRWGPNDMGSGHLANSATLHVFGPDGLRGALHRADDDGWTVIGETAATPGCLPGPIAAGPWDLDVETGLILNDGAGAGYLDWHVEAAALLGEPGAGPRPIASPARSRSGPPGGARWYRGDLHSHTVHSDGRFTVNERLRTAVARGLDFIAVTDHNTVSHHRELVASGEPIVAIRGSEVTTFHGHMNVFGLRTAIDWRADRRGTGPARIVEQAHGQGALVSVNHPSSFGDPWCVGCHWDFARVDWSTVDAMEIWNGGWSDVETANEQNIAFWTDLLEAGVRLTAISGTDSHGPADDDDATLGFTYVHATEPGEQAILDGIRRGRVFLSRGPTLSFRAIGSDGAEVRLPGAELPADGTLRLTVDLEGLDRPSTIWFVSSGSKVPLAACEPGTARVVDGRALEAIGWWRLEVRAGSAATGDLLVLTNPVYVAAGADASELDRQGLERPVRRGLDPDDGAADGVGRDPSEQLLEGDPRLEPRQRRSEAVVDAITEGDVALRVAREVEPVRFRPMPLVAIGRRPDEPDAGASRDDPAVQRDRAGRGPRQHLDRRVEPEELLDRRGRDRRLGAQQVPLVRVSIEVQERVRDQPGRRGDARDEQEHRAPEDLVGAHLAGPLGRDQEGHEVLAGRDPALRRRILHVRPQRIATGDRPRRERALAGVALEHRAEPAEQPGVIRLREAEPGEHRGPRERSREVPGEVGVALVGEGVDELDHLAADDRLETRPEGRGAERHPERSAQAGVDRRVHAGQVAGGQEQLPGVVDVVAHPAFAGREGLPVPGGGLHVVEPRQDPQVEPFVVVQRRLVAQAPVDRVWIVERDERVPGVAERLVDGLHRVIEPKLNHTSQP